MAIRWIRRSPPMIQTPSSAGSLVVYAQDEWKITDKLTLNAGLRFDQMWQYVSANQLSPRASIVFKPVEDTTFHVAYARYFTPPSQALSAPTNLAVYNNTDRTAGDPPIKPRSP